MTYLIAAPIYNVGKQQDNTAVAQPPCSLRHHRPSLYHHDSHRAIHYKRFSLVCVCVCGGGLSHVMMYLLMIGRDVYTTILLRPSANQ